MTLSPVFRSPQALESITGKGYLDRLAPSIESQRRYVRTVHELLGDVLDAHYIAPSQSGDNDEVTFFQERFFLILFDSVFRSLDCPPDRLETYGLLNVCIKGLVVAGDNLFDDEHKMDLPLALDRGHRFASIMQLLCFDHLVTRIFERCTAFAETEDVARYRRALLSALAAIGTLEGSEEEGVGTVLPVERMIEKVHRVRGGQLFALAFIAPGIWEPAEKQPRWRTAREGIARLGTAFQIVDDLTDFEFDLGRASHNVLAAQITHEGTVEEKATLEQLLAAGSVPVGAVERGFVHSAQAVLERARKEARLGFEALQQVGFWFPPDEAHLFVSAIAGDAGDARMKAVLEEAPASRRPG